MKLVLKILLPIVVLAAGYAGFRYMVSMRPEAKRVERKERSEKVEARALKPGQHAVDVQGMGTVVPARRLALQPEVSGRVIEHSANLVPGGRVSEGEVLVGIDSEPFDLAVAEAESRVARARFELKLEGGRGSIAAREWDMLKGSGATAHGGKELALRKPHLAAARAALAAAESGLELARLNVDRCVIEAPFDAVVIEEAVETGQLVGPQSRLATLVATDSYWVHVSVPVDRLVWIDVPGVNGGGPAGSKARIRHEIAPGAVIEREGRVVRLLSDLDPVGRMARVVVEVRDPFGAGASPPASLALPLLLRAYVEVSIEGRRLDEVFEVPRVALRGGDRVFIVDSDERLAVREVDVVFRRLDAVLVKGGLEPGDRVITSRVATPAPGLKLRVDDEEAEPPAIPAPQEAAAEQPAAPSGPRPAGESPPPDGPPPAAAKAR